jgi:hypothetical protein
LEGFRRKSFVGKCLDLKFGGSISHNAMLNNEDLPNTLQRKIVAIESKCNARLSLANNFSKKKQLQWREKPKS